MSPRQGAAAPGGGPVGEILRAYLGEQLAQLREQEPLVRLDVPDSVHRMRVAARRARSALATYAPILEPRAGDRLRSELRWLGQALGQARDHEVLRARLDDLLEEQPDSPARRLAGRRIDAELAARYDAGTGVTAETLDSARYARLLVDLDRFVGSPPFNEHAARPATTELVRLLERDWRLLTKRAAAVEGASGRTRRDLALHAVRKAAKRLRYAAESAASVLGDPAESLADSCTVIQDVLGEQHDSAVTRETLRAMQATAGGAGEQHPTFENLHAREHERGLASEERYEAALRVLGSRKHNTLRTRPPATAPRPSHPGHGSGPGGSGSR